MKKIILVALVAVTLACGYAPGVATNNMQPLNTPQPTATITPLPTPTQLVIQPEILVVKNGQYNLRPNSDGSGGSLGIVYNGTRLEVIESVDGWALVQTVEEDELDVLSGWVNKGCCVVR